MAQGYIRIAKTPEIERVLADLRKRFTLLNEAEIIKFALSDIHTKELEAKMEKEQKIREAFRVALEEGGKRGDEILADMGVKRENMTEQEIYEAIFGPAKGTRKDRH
jgi:hypothetical protein